MTALRSLLAAALLAPVAAAPSAPGDPFTAVRAPEPLAIDGRLEEPAWDLAPVHDGFVQRFPDEGAEPTERTEVRVLYDDRTLYVGVVAHDRRPGEIRRPLGRRDGAPYSDAISVVVDSVRDGRTGFFFEINAAGVQTDGLLLESDEFEDDWDAVWDGAAASFPGGWSAEFAIPLAALRFAEREELVFGFGVRRVLARRHEEVLSVRIPRNAKGEVARLGVLQGLRGLHPVRAFELAPYLSARTSLRPRASDGAPATPRILDPVGEVGVDLRTTLGSGLSLQATVNPDFGQVEADEIIQNLSTFEVFFPEKRPFFTQGMDLFESPSPPNRSSPQQLFYSRRVGLDAPILAAAKLSGKAADGLQIGLVEAFVTGAGNGGPDDDPPRDLRFHPEQPFRLGPRSALPTLDPATRNFAAAVARWRPGPLVNAGAIATSALLLDPLCTAAEADLDDEVRPTRCDVRAGNALAADAAVRTRDGEWYALAQVTGSQSLGGPPVRVLADGTRLLRGDLGFGAHAAAGRRGGEPWRIEAHWEYESPKLDLNASGFQRTQNEQLGRAILRRVRPGGSGPFHSYVLALGAESRWTTDGRGLDRGARVWLASEFQLRSFQWFGCNAFLDTVRWDVREVVESGVAARRPASILGECWFSSDRSRVLFAEGGLGVGTTFEAGPLAPMGYWGTSGRVVFRPHARVETRLDGKLDWSGWRARYVDADGAGSYLFADLRAPALSLTLRQQVVLTRRLTLQGYAQLFSAHGRYGAFHEATPVDGRIRFSDLRPRARPVAGDPADPFEFVGDPEFRESALNVNVVLRWEYRLGSTLYVVYTRSQAEPEWEGPGPAPASLRPWALGDGPATDTLLVKWTVFLDG